MYVCSKSLCLSWKTLNQGSQKLSSTVFRLIMYVCLKKVQNPSACHAFCNSDITREAVLEMNPDVFGIIIDLDAIGPRRLGELATVSRRFW